ATFLAPSIVWDTSDVELIAIRASMLAKHDEDKFSLLHNFGPGELVLVFNKNIESNISRKCKPHYFGPTVVVIKRLCSGAYILAEVNGAVSRLKFTAFRLIP
ncbi:hypothetical protein AX17_006507, partial [Amanita inopinata Kibby_2008]